MVDDIKRIKAEKQQEDLEAEVKDVKAGKLKVEIKADEVTVEPVVESATVKIEPAAKVGETDNRSGKRRGGGREGRGGRGGRGREGRRESDLADDWEQKIVDLARVTRVMAGGKRMRFRACVVIGNRKGQVAYGLGKGQDVTMAISKAVVKAKKQIVTVPFVHETIPFAVEEKFKAAKVLLRPAAKGKGIIAGGAVRAVLQLAGVPNVVAKILGNNNKMTNVKATINALDRLGQMSKRFKAAAAENAGARAVAKN